MTRKSLFFPLASVLGLLACDDTTNTTSTGGSGGSQTSSSSSGAQTTSSSTGTGGLPNVEASDACPGNVIELGLDQSIKLTGTTIGAKDDYHEFCADSDPMTTSAPDVVYQLKTDHYCSFTADIDDGGTWDSAFELRAMGCADRTGGDECINKTKHLGRELPPGTYFIVVDGAGKTSGAFSLTLNCASPKCGDGILNSSEEQCDVGTSTPGDGCGDPGTPSACKFETTVAPDACADITPTVGTVAIAKGQTVFVPTALPLFNTAQGKDDYEGSCSFTGFSGPDQVFAVQPSGSGVLTVVIGRDYNGIDYCQPPGYNQPECWNSVAWIHEADCSNDTAKELTLADMPTPPIDGNGFGQNGNASCRYSTVATNNVLTLNANVTAGKTYYLFVEGDTPEGAGHSGPYLLNMKLQ
ncbi:MAG: DUF4215 domain-containing protein [Polyangiaceae bacterium]